MTLLRDPLDSDAANGSSGDLTFVCRRGSTYAYPRTPVPWVSTTGRDNHRSLLQDLAYWWSAISDAQRAAWRVYAETHLSVNRLHQPIGWSAFDWFLHYSLPTYRGAGAMVLDPPPPLRLPNPAVISAFPDDVNIGGAALSPEFPNPHLCVFEAWFEPIRAAHLAPRRRLALLFSAAPAESYQITFAAPYSGFARLWTRIVDVPTGHRSIWQHWNITWL